MGKGRDWGGRVFSLKVMNQYSPLGEQGRPKISVCVLLVLLLFIPSCLS